MIGIDPLDKEVMLDAVLQKHQTDLEGLSDADKEKIKKTLGMLMDHVSGMYDRIRKAAIDDVLKVFDAVAVSNNLPFIRESIEGLKKV